MANLHIAAEGYQLPDGASMPTLTDALWGTTDHLQESNPKLTAEQVGKLRRVIGEIQKTVDRLYQSGSPIALHADMHGWNLMWHEGQVSVFDFDDSAFGFPIQDLATAIYYLDDDEPAAWRAGYESVRPWPEISAADWETLIIQRRIFLQNYIFDTADPEVKGMWEKYLAETIRRVETYLESRG